jgi:hypothetical protein
MNHSRKAGRTLENNQRKSKPENRRYPANFGSPKAIPLPRDF